MTLREKQQIANCIKLRIQQQKKLNFITEDLFKFLSNPENKKDEIKSETLKKHRQEARSHYLTFARWGNRVHWFSAADVNRNTNSPFHLSIRNLQGDQWRRGCPAWRKQTFWIRVMLHTSEYGSTARAQKDCGAHQLHCISVDSTVILISNDPLLIFPLIKAYFKQQLAKPSFFERQQKRVSQTFYSTHLPNNKFIPGCFHYQKKQNISKDAITNSGKWC